MPRRNASPVLAGASVSGQAVGLTTSDFFLPFFHYMPIPRRTYPTNPYSYTLILPHGVVRQVTIEFPKGCAGFVGVQLWRGVRQVFPLPEGVWLKSDNSILTFRLTEVIDAEPFSIEFRGYNADVTYTHQPWIGFEMSGPKSILSSKMEALTTLL